MDVVLLRRLADCCLEAAGWAHDVAAVRILMTGAVSTAGLIRSGERFILKLFPPDSCRALTDARVRALACLEHLGSNTPRVVTSGAAVMDGSSYSFTISSYVSGSAVAVPDVSTFSALGVAVARLHVALSRAGVEETWLAHGRCSAERCAGSSGQGRPWAAGSDGEPIGPTLAEAGIFQLVHGDLHTGNIVTTGADFGFFDFEDMRFSDPLDDIAAVLGFIKVCSYPAAAKALISGYINAAPPHVQADRLNGRDLVTALACRFEYLAGIQLRPTANEKLLVLERSLRAAAEEGCGIEDWMARRTS
jgi:hypothetical protein